MAELRSYNGDRRAHKIFAVWIFTDEVCHLLFWTKGYVIILNVPAIYLERRDSHHSRHSLEEFFSSLHDLVLRPLLCRLEVRCPSPHWTMFRNHVSPRAKPASWKLEWGTEMLDGQQNRVLPKPQLLFMLTGLMDHHPFPA